MHDSSSIIVMPNLNILLSAQRLVSPNGCVTLLKTVVDEVGVTNEDAAK
jgi:hypothetical protein